MCLCARYVLSGIGDGSTTRPGSAFNRTSLLNIVLKSSFAHLSGARLNFAHLNPGSAVPHIGELNSIFDGTDLQAIAVSETWFKTKHSDAQVSLSGFRVVRANRGGGRRAGGVALYLRNGIRYKVVERSTPTSVVDYLFVELRLPFPVLICVIYNPPDVDGFSIYGPLLEPLISKYPDILVLGDFNHDVLKSTNRVRNFLEELNKLNLHVHSNHPTNFQANFQPTCIDLFATNRPECVQLFSQIDLPGIPTTHDLIYGSYLHPSTPELTELPASLWISKI